MKYAHLVWKNLWRNKLRTAMTGGAIMLAVVLVCLLLTMPAGMDAMLNDFCEQHAAHRPQQGRIVYSMPYSFVRKVRQVDGVAAAVAWWFGGAFEQDGRVTFPELRGRGRAHRRGLPTIPSSPSSSPT